jgi:peroxiredoxin
MLTIGDPFPQICLASSKGGTVNLHAVFSGGTTIVGIIPREVRDVWLEASAERIYSWMINAFVNVYLVLDTPSQEARELCDTYGIQASILCDTAQQFVREAGFYRIGTDGVIEDAVSLDEGTAALGRLG